MQRERLPAPARAAQGEIHARHAAAVVQRRYDAGYSAVLAPLRRHQRAERLAFEPAPAVAQEP
jgi:hypothetical protein